MKKTLLYFIFLFISSGCGNHYNLPLPTETEMIKRPPARPSASIIIEENTIYQNGRTGIRIRGDTPVDITHCKIYDNGRSGLLLEHRADILISDSHIHHNRFGGLSLNGVKNAIVESNKIHQNGKTGIRLRKGVNSRKQPTDVTVKNNNIFLNGTGGIHSIPKYDAPIDLKVYDNIIHANKRGGIRITNNTRLTAFKNEIFDNGAAGIAAYSTAPIPPLLNLYRNRIYFNEGGGILVDNGISGEYGISNNLIYNNKRAGIACGLWEESGNSVVDLSILHNTIVSNGSNERGAGIRNDSKGTVRIFNNIIAYNYTTGIQNNNCSDASYNLLYANWATSSFDESSDEMLFLKSRLQYGGCRGIGKGSMITEPLFTDPDNYDFTLLEDSPAKEAATRVNSPHFSSFTNNMGVVAPIE